MKTPYRAEPGGGSPESDLERLRRVRGAPSDRERLNRVRARANSPPPPPAGLTMTPLQKAMWLVPVFLVSAWFARGLAEQWEMTVPGAWLVLVGICMLGAATIWRTAVIWEEVADGPAEGIFAMFFLPFRWLGTFFLFTAWEKMKGPFFLSLQGTGMVVLGYIVNSVFRAPAT